MEEEEEEEEEGAADRWLEFTSMAVASLSLASFLLTVFLESPRSFLQGCLHPRPLIGRGCAAKGREGTLGPGAGSGETP